MSQTNNPNQMDRDILIRLDEKFNIFSNQVTSDIGELKETTKQRTADIYKKIDDLNGWKSGIQANLRFIAMTSSIIGGMIGAVATAILAIANIIHL